MFFPVVENCAIHSVKMSHGIVTAMHGRATENSLGGRSATRRSVSGARALELGRTSISTQAWAAAFMHLSVADSQQPLNAADLESLAMSAHLIGKETECAELLARAHRGFLDEGLPRRAAQCAYRLGFTSLLNDEVAQAGGWFTRAQRLLEGQGDCVEKGYLLLPGGYRAVHAGRPAEAFQTFEQAAKIGERFGDNDLVTLARQGQGRALIRQGEIARGVSFLDEAMVAVRAGDVTPIIAGSVYCSVLEACGEIFDLRRAREWTSALDHWCASQPDIVPYRNHCLVRRAEVLQLQGSWDHALAELGRPATGFLTRCRDPRWARLYTSSARFIACVENSQRLRKPTARQASGRKLRGQDSRNCGSCRERLTPRTRPFGMSPMK